MLERAVVFYVDGKRHVKTAFTYTDDELIRKVKKEYPDARIAYIYLP